jgi:hypothetical protein
VNGHYKLYEATQTGRIDTKYRIAGEIIPGEEVGEGSEVK